MNKNQKILKKEKEIWDKVREEFDNDFYIANTGVCTDKMLLLLFEHKLKQLRRKK